ncbi:MAG TPA: hypothetical protein VFL45_08770 [Gammaproteobacteria bacterium]|nr:hypothetical protein [Gammaproteobacteria bacterium]
MLHFKYLPAASLPKLAWCARIARNNDEILVEHGDWVETHGNFFIEGAWDGPFSRGAIDEARILLGSGGQVREGDVTFCTTTHTKERLQSIRLRDEILISNSFAYLLNAAGDSVDINYRFYERDFMTSLNGITKARKFVPTAARRRVRIHYSEKITIDRNLGIRTERYGDSPDFSTFEEYVDVVNGLLASLTRNAGDAARKKVYRPLSTISTGYDSPAATVFAKRHGCDEALTFLDARTEYNDPEWGEVDGNDSGLEIARYLKIGIRTFRRNGYDQRSDHPEAEFIATGNGGDDVIMCNAEQCLSGTMLYTGFLGDVVWDCKSEHQEQSRDYVYKDPSGASFNEFRLRVGFIHVPIPLLTFTRHPELHRISHSDDMAPWRIGGTYDRPIPRRLVETAGVPRHLYAQSKKAITQPIWLPLDFERTMLPESYRDLSQWAERIEARASRSTRLKKRLSPLVRDWLLPAAFRLMQNINWYDAKQARLTGVRLTREFNNTIRQSAFSAVYGSLAGLKFHWAVSKMRARYQDSRFVSVQSQAVAQPSSGAAFGTPDAAGYQLRERLDNNSPLCNKRG